LQRPKPPACAPVFILTSTSTHHMRQGPPLAGTSRVAAPAAVIIRRSKHRPQHWAEHTAHIPDWEKDVRTGVGRRSGIISATLVDGTEGYVPLPIVCACA
jgi:hypothetical protein